MIKNDLNSFYSNNKIIIDAILSNKEQYYKNFSIPKKRSGFRIISQPLKELFILQKEMSILFLKGRTDLKDVSHAFERNKSIISNAQKHINKVIVLNIDFKDFFSNIKKEDVYKSLDENYDASNETLSKLCDLLTLNDCLPIGSPSSPTLSNYVCKTIDSQLKDYCINESVIPIEFSRYADDLTFSFTDSSNFNNHLINIFSIIQECGFIINHKKVRYFYKNKRQVVTGLVVNEKVNVSRVFYKNLRAILYNWSQKGFEIASINFYSKYPGKKDFISTIHGWINFYGQVKGKNDLKYIEFKELFRLLNIEHTLHFNKCKVYSILLKELQQIVKIDHLNFYSDESDQDSFVQFNSDNKIILKILKSDAFLINESPKVRIDVSYHYFNNFKNYNIKVRQQDKTMSESKAVIQYSHLQFLPKSKPLISIRQSNPNAIIALQTSSGTKLEGLDENFLNYKVNSYGSIDKVEPSKILINSARGVDALNSKTIGHTWAVHRVGSMINPTTMTLVETYRATKVQRFITPEVFSSIQWAIAVNKIFNDKKVPSKYRMTKQVARDIFLLPLNKKMGWNISNDDDLVSYIQHFAKLTHLGIDKIKQIKKIANVNWDLNIDIVSNIGFKILMFEQYFSLDELTVLNNEFIVQNTSKLGLSGNNILCLLSDKGVQPYLTSAGNEGTYHDYLLDSLYTDIIISD
jgi:RNA-directed DNA polymerase